MKNMVFFIILLNTLVPVQAQTYQCKQTSGEYLFSDKPCVNNSQIEEKTKIDFNGVIVHLSTRQEPIPLPNRVVNHFLNDISSACNEKNGEKLLSYYSKTMQEYIKPRIIDGDVFNSVSYICNDVKNIKHDIDNSLETTLFASKMPYKTIVLCLYSAKKGLDNCIGNMKIIAEDGKLKLDGF